MRRRELAAQVAAVGRTLHRTAGLRCAMLYGGADRAGQACSWLLRPLAGLCKQTCGVFAQTRRSKSAPQLAFRYVMGGCLLQVSAKPE